MKEISEIDEFVPEWAKSVIWYQILPERFRNGDKNNDPKIYNIKGADPQELPKAWKVHPWGSDWYKLQDYEKINGEHEFWKHSLRRRYGGDFKGIIDKLDYLEDLGISAIYLNPVFDSPSLHKYDGASYHHIDPNFGPDPKGDRKLIEKENPLEPESWVWTSADELALELIEQVHSRKMKIIFDGVFNHMGLNSFAFKDIIENQQNSIYKDWFKIISWDDPLKEEKFDYKGWWGVKSLPEFAQDEKGIVKGPRDYIFEATKRWLNPKNKGVEYGIDGWRLDVAFCIAHSFWKDWRNFVKSINPNAYITAELIDTPDNVIPYFKGDEFDGEMNYNFAFCCSEFFFDPNNKISSSEFDRKLKQLRNIYPKGVAEVSINLFGSHDSNRIASHIVNRGIWNYRDWNNYYQKSKFPDNPDYKIRKPYDEEIVLQKLFVIFQMTYIGAPMIYYGDEVGMWGANDPDCRKPMIWEDIIFDDEMYNPDQSTRNPDKVEINYDLLNHYKKLISIRNKHQALKIGDYKTILTDDANDVFAFERKLEEEKIVVIINNGCKHIDININLDGNYYDVLNNREVKPNLNHASINISPKWAAILVSKII